MSNYMMLACENLRKEILAFLPKSGTSFPILFIPQELHNSPDNLRAYLQNTIDSIANIEYLLLPMGKCGNGTIGLISDDISIVLPDCDDCIDMMLSEENGSITRKTYSYYLTESWLTGKQSINNEYARAMDKYGPKRGPRIMKALYNNYRQFTFLDTSTYDPYAAMPLVEYIAQLTDMEVGIMPARCSMLKRMLSLDLNSGFIIVPPGEAVSNKHFSK